ncbi:MAG: hypothetical protein AB7Q42_06170 [Acidimicrobiia bacterium]
MFIQVIEGKTHDADALHRQLEVWQRDLMPGAIGYLGSTGGCTSNGDCILVARFESREAAQRNSDRPEQTQWWQETMKCFDGDVRFHDSVDVQVMEHGTLDDAHFVQVMEGHVMDRSRAEMLEREADPMLAEMRPELIGAVTAFFDGDEFAELAYFTSEEAAREGERQEPPPEAAAQMAEWERVMKVERYLDIKDPWLISA